MPALHLSSLLNKDLIKINITSESLENIYAILLDEICELFKLPVPCSDLLQKIIEREKEASTVFPTGVSIPHVHIEDYDDTIIGIAIPSEPVHTEHGDIKMLIMVISGTLQNTLYLHILQSIIKLSKDTVLFDKLVKVRKPDEFIELIARGDFALKRNVTVSDLMSNKIFYVKREMSLKELGNIFYEKNYGYCPVVDDNLNLIGEVTVLDLIMTGFPDYTNYLGNMNFLKSFEPFETLLREEKNIKVIDIMKKVECQLTPEASLIEAVFLMKKNRRRDIPVVVNKKIVGIISFMDIFRKIIRG
ncbi:MAG TPA: CBS domain-containing protein [Candidatus Cloacimonadota bacterium]|mgnify:CR=1|nr:CBS domain-containing protein [Candidatus Cloacimonadota bacterium]HOD55349.1 CBS domain-containing protein [Candidatus Cloacimonadota bacterium]HPM01080.1 CBS domain-containing protein [Candidatus Cloacimonadota bacterium]